MSNYWRFIDPNAYGTFQLRVFALGVVKDHSYHSFDVLCFSLLEY